MIKNMMGVVLLMGIIGLTTQCQQANRTPSNEKAPITANKSIVVATDTSLYAVLEREHTAPSLPDSVIIRFTVVNPTEDSLRFTQYHTPFEGLISKFLTVTDSTGKEVDYIGPMAKRVMPPPASTYDTIAPGQHESVTFDLKKCYNIEYPGTYTLQYNAQRISGIADGKPITITVAE